MTRCATGVPGIRATHGSRATKRSARTSRCSSGTTSSASRRRTGGTGNPPLRGGLGPGEIGVAVVDQLLARDGPTGPVRVARLVHAEARRTEIEAVQIDAEQV